MLIAQAEFIACVSDANVLTVANAMITKKAAATSLIIPAPKY